MGNVIVRQSADDEPASVEWWEAEETPQQNVEEHPLALSSLPQNLIRNIVNKLDFTDYVQMEQTSKSIATTLENSNFSLSIRPPIVLINKKTVKIVMALWPYDTMPRIRWHVATSSAARIDTDSVEIACRASSGRMKAVAKLFEKNKTTAYSIQIRESIRFQPEDLDRLITVLKPTYLDCRQFLRKEFFADPEQGLNKINTCYFYTTGCTDEELLKWKCLNVRMENDFITDRGLNRFLKQWKKDEREFNWYCIEFGSSFGRRDFNTILQGLVANPIWTPDMHEYSLVAGIPMEEFELMETGDPQHVYSLWKPERPEKIHILLLSQSRFEIISANDEASAILGYLNEDQFYEIRKKCRWCDGEFCCHRGRYSTQRFKKFFPRVNDAIIKGFQVANVALFAARCVQPLLGFNLLHVPLSIEDRKRIWYEEEANRSFYNKCGLEESLDLSSLPQKLVNKIVDKLSYHDFVQLEQTSKSMTTALSDGEFALERFVDCVFINKKTVKMACYSNYYDNMFGIRRISWHVVDKAARIRIGILYLNCRATNARLRAMTKLFKKNKTTTGEMWIMEHVTFEPEALFELVKVEGIALDTNGCTDEDLLKLKLAYIKMTSDFITDRGLNRFLKQWKDRERHLIYFSMDFGSSLGTRNFDTVLDGLDANPLWTPDMHEYSLVSAIKLEDFELMKRGDPQHVYIIWNSNFPEDVRLIMLSQRHVEVITILSETHMLTDFYLNDDQFYLVRRECRYCRKEFCIHRRRYPTQRFKKFFPQVNEAIIKGIKTVTMLLLGFRCIQQIRGTAAPCSLLLNIRRIHYEEEANFSLFNNVISHMRIYLLNQ